jgi:hypothetical protein
MISMHVSDAGFDPNMSRKKSIENREIHKYVKIKNHTLK